MLHFVEFTSIHLLLLLTANEGQEVFESPSRHWVRDRVTPWTVHWSITGHTHNIYITLKFRIHVERPKLESNLRPLCSQLAPFRVGVCLCHQIIKAEIQADDFHEMQKDPQTFRELSHTPKKTNKNNKNRDITIPEETMF